MIAPGGWAPKLAIDTYTQAAMLESPRVKKVNAVNMTIQKFCFFVRFGKMTFAMMSRPTQRAAPIASPAGAAIGATDLIRSSVIVEDIGDGSA